MGQIFHILKYKTIAYIRLNTKIDLPSLLKNAGSGFIYAGFAVASFYFTQKMIHFLLVQIKVGLFLLHEFMSIILFIFFLSVNVGNIIVSYSTLYKSDEVIYYFTKPVNPYKIFIIKFLDNFFYSSSTMILIMFSVIMGYAVYFKMPIPVFISLIIVNLIPFILSAGSLGVIILLLILKLASRFGVKKVLCSLIASYVSVVLFFFAVNSPIKLVNTVMKYYPIFDKDKYLGELLPYIIKYLPNHWFAQSAYWTINKNTSEIVLYSLSQIILAAVLFSTAFILGKRWYLDTWLKNQTITSNYITARNNKVRFFSFFKASSLKPQTESILKKDLLVFMREPSQVIHILILVFLIAIFISSVAGIKYFVLGNHFLITTIYLSIFLFNLLLISTFSLRFIFPLISLEGLAFWKIKSAPVDNKYFVINKLIPIGVLIFIIGQSLSLFANVNLGLFMIVLSSYVTFFSTATIISINFGMGVSFVNYKEKNPIRLSSSQGASISFLITICYMLFVVLLLFTPLLELFFTIRVNKEFDLMKLIIPLIPITIVSAAVTLMFAKNGFDALRKDF